MKITKIGHCCLLIEEKGLRILTDPGAWSEAQNELKNIQLILITHEHQDHFYLDSLKQVLKNNPEAKIITNLSVNKLLLAENIQSEILETDKITNFQGLNLKALGKEHAEIYNDFGRVENTGFLLGEKFFYPGDAFTLPEVPIEVLALPVCGPWLTIKQSINFALAVKPKMAFPVHDGMLKIFGPFHAVPQKLLKEQAVEFIPLLSNENLTV
jgi:L-ascorbate metabolism protein UlaG (beta-lactamase superfamily)